MQLEAVCLCSTGRIRKNNEDNFYFDGRSLPVDNQGLKLPLSRKMKVQPGMLYCVFDGMGGEEAGEIASFTAASETTAYCARNTTSVPPRQFLLELCAGANAAVCRKNGTLDSGRMGTTLVSLYFGNGQVYVCNIGDSPCFRLRDNTLLQLSEDHVEHLPPESRHKPRLTQFVGVDPEELTLEPFVAGYDLKKGDQYLLCSDGLTDMVPSDEIRKILKEHAGTRVAVTKLVERALENGGRDNVTVILCRVK